MKTFMDVPVRESLLYQDSRGRVALEMNQGNFSQVHKIMLTVSTFTPKKARCLRASSGERDATNRVSSSFSRNLRFSRPCERATCHPESAHFRVKDLNVKFGIASLASTICFSPSTGTRIKKISRVTAPPAHWSDHNRLRNILNVPFSELESPDRLLQPSSCN